ncbi:hypothetical protein PUN28_016063 [Cardiocondyla obscurior]|uniref:Uncharacterized protein n=1 Tax=Cardiocondyla obscurior TaxID=286306 RepID=A0AAW2EW12_9HYME
MLLHWGNSSCQLDSSTIADLVGPFVRSLVRSPSSVSFYHAPSPSTLRPSRIADRTSQPIAVGRHPFSSDRGALSPTTHHLLCNFVT